MDWENSVNKVYILLHKGIYNNKGILEQSNGRNGIYKIRSETGISNDIEVSYVIVGFVVFEL